MAKMVKLKSGEEVSVRARCSNPKCSLLLISENDDSVTSANEKNYLL